MPRLRHDDLTPEQQGEAERLFEAMREATEDELWQIARLLASQSDNKLLGRTEFEVRDQVHKIGAKAIETAVNQRKKGGIKGPV